MKTTGKEIDQIAADNIRALAVAIVEKAQSGHPGGPMGEPILCTYYIQSF